MTGDKGQVTGDAIPFLGEVLVLVLELISAHIERFSVSHMQDFVYNLQQYYKKKYKKKTQNTAYGRH